MFLFVYGLHLARFSEPCFIFGVVFYDKLRIYECIGQINRDIMIGDNRYTSDTIGEGDWTIEDLERLGEARKTDRQKHRHTHLNSLTPVCITFTIKKAFN